MKKNTLGASQKKLGCASQESAATQVFFFMFVFLWFRATFPRYRYDQIMRLGWKALIPVTLIWLLVEGVMVYGHVGPWKGYI